MTDTDIQSTGIADAAKEIEALLAGEDAETETPEDQADSRNQPSLDEEDGEAAEDAEHETTDDQEDGEDADDQEDEGSEDDADAEDEEPEETSSKLPKTVTVTIDGKAEKVSLDEAVKGYQRHADYSRKTAKLADDRRAFDADHQAVVQERAQYAHLLGMLQRRLTELSPQEPDWQKLWAEDPIEAIRLKEEWRDRQDQIANANSEAERVAGLATLEQRKAQAKRVEESRQKLNEYRPAWKDDAKWLADREQIKAYALGQGFSAEEIAMASDHRAFIALDKARKYDAIMANKPKPNAPKGAVKPLKPGSAIRNTRTVSTHTRAKQRLAKTGSVNDAAAVFAGMAGLFD